MKKLIFIALGIFLFLAGCQNSKTDKETQKSLRVPEPEKTSLEDTYVKSLFRVLVVKKHPTEPYYFVVATERAKEGEPPMNDTSCGSMYTQPTCYFFIEPDFYLNAPKTRFIGKYSKPPGGETGGLEPDSIIFPDKNHVEFMTVSGDAGFTIKVRWSLNIDTGELIEVERKTKYYEDV